jgi:hypothetical protein
MIKLYILSSVKPFYTAKQFHATKLQNETNSHSLVTYVHVKNIKSLKKDNLKNISNTYSF